MFGRAYHLASGMIAIHNDPRRQAGGFAVEGTANFWAREMSSRDEKRKTDLRTGADVHYYCCKNYFTNALPEPDPFIKPAV